MEGFRGDILQIPPMYSALKVNGKKLYELARKGREVERKPRPVTIYGLEVLGEEPGGFTLRVKCSKGTYIRTLCYDIGAALGCGGCMSALRRTEAAGFTLDDAVTLDAVQAAADRGEGEAMLLPVDAYFRDHPALTVRGAAERKVRNGNAVDWAGPDGVCRVYGEGGDFLMLGEVRDGVLRTVKSFFEV